MGSPRRAALQSAVAAARAAGIDPRSMPADQLLEWAQKQSGQASTAQRPAAAAPPPAAPAKPGAPSLDQLENTPVEGSMDPADATAAPKTEGAARKTKLTAEQNKSIYAFLTTNGVPKKKLDRMTPEQRLDMRNEIVANAGRASQDDVLPPTPKDPIQVAKPKGDGKGAAQKAPAKGAAAAKAAGGKKAAAAAARANAPKPKSGPNGGAIVPNVGPVDTGESLSQRPVSTSPPEPPRFVPPPALQGDPLVRATFGLGNMIRRAPITVPTVAFGTYYSQPIIRGLLGMMGQGQQPAGTQNEVQPQFPTAGSMGNTDEYWRRQAAPPPQQPAVQFPDFLMPKPPLQ